MENQERPGMPANQQENAPGQGVSPAARRRRRRRAAKPAVAAGAAPAAPAKPQGQPAARAPKPAQNPPRPAAPRPAPQRPGRAPARPGDGRRAENVPPRAPRQEPQKPPRAPAPPAREEDPGLMLISRRPPRQKFANFEEYMAARGGETAPIPGDLPRGEEEE